MIRRIFLAAIAGVVLGWTATANVWAQEACCASCGCHAGCQKVCRLVYEDKKVPVTCWGSKKEDFCIPGRSTPGCQHSETVCDECETAGALQPDCVKAKNFVWRDWIPGCATIHTKTKLMKKTVTQKVPSFKWVVEDLCEPCRVKAAASAAPTKAKEAK